MDLLAAFYVGDTITSLQKTSLVPGASDCIIYTTIGGSIGILVPFISKDVSFPLSLTYNLQHSLAGFELVLEDRARKLGWDALASKMTSRKQKNKCPHRKRPYSYHLSAEAELLFMTQTDVIRERMNDIYVSLSYKKNERETFSHYL